MTIDRRSLLGAVGGLTAVAAGQAEAAPKARGKRPAAYVPTEPTITYRGPTPDIEPVGLRWAFSATVFFAQREMVQSPTPRGFTWAAGGEIWGPRLQGRVLPYSGADYFHGSFQTHYMLEASDGGLIYIHNRGTMRRFKGEPEPGQQPVDFTGPPAEAPWTRFRATTVFDAPLGPHDWMNHTVFVGNATRKADPDHTVFTYYEVV
jgi:hypothetical protein